ncbi:MAG TPA: glycosyltransferase [Bacteroidetes bacterium]|nr:glycosyltransferase [Bacteroidota bacterium]
MFFIFIFIFILILFSISLSGAYFFIILKYKSAWRACPEWHVPNNYFPKTKVTVIVPARNEAKNIIACLQSISKIEYPKELLEIIIVDDHSTDGTYQLVIDFIKNKKCFKIIKLADFINNKNIGSYKKKAIETAISQSSGELIATTDADCIVPPAWLPLLVSFYEKYNLKFIAAPVNFHREKSVFERFQSLDFLGMMGVTAAGIRLKWMNMCNGANLAYPKSAFLAVDGFAGIDNLASGDDILLMQKIAARFPGKIGFLKNKNAVVRTEAKPSISSFISQRLRWATKSTSYREWKTTFLLAIVFLYCSAIVFSFFLIPFLGWKAAALFLFLFLIKTIADYIFLREMADYFGRKDLMKIYLPAQLLHLIYIVVVGFFGNVKKKYAWKGREVR